MKVTAYTGTTSWELAALDGKAFAEIKAGELGKLEAIPTYYNADDPEDIWPLPLSFVSVVWKYDA